MSVVEITRVGIYSVDLVKDELGGHTSMTNYELHFKVNDSFQLKHSIQVETTADGTVYVNNRVAEVTAVDQFNSEITVFNEAIVDKLGATVDFRSALDNLLFGLKLIINANGIPQGELK